MTGPDTRGVKSAEGFSLVEVVLAVGIAAFAIVSIMGLLTVSLTTTRESMIDTLVVNMAEHVLADIRQQPFTNLVSSLDPVTATNYFDDLGKPLASPDNTGFLCKVVCEPDPATLNLDPKLPPSEKVSLVRLRLVFSQAGRDDAIKVIQSSVANY